MMATAFPIPPGADIKVPTESGKFHRAARSPFRIKSNPSSAFVVVDAMGISVEREATALTWVHPGQADPAVDDVPGF